VLLEGLGKLKTPNDRIGNRTRNLPAWSIALQPLRYRMLSLSIHMATKLWHETSGSCAGSKS
jgi:hypothetical protein